ncbi:MAG: phosphate ABC transporter ATP-binding protein [SAR324 cluster bacterium]|nr:phosphate ABC transporter ATP-binding protein [SAR324 cluster bacterium]
MAPVQTTNKTSIIKITDLDFFYGDTQALFKINLTIAKNRITSFIGPSGCGKSTLLRCMNRMYDVIRNTKASGSILFDNNNILQTSTDVTGLRRRIGMVFQKSNPFAKTIYENVVYGLRIAGENKKSVLDQAVEESLKGTSLFDEVKDRLNESALGLSGGQMQRLCIARAIAIKPDVILMDEPCSALDPKSTAKVEELMLNLKKDYSIVIVTHNMQQSSRISEYTAFFLEGRLMEKDTTQKIFTNPSKKETEDYITGKFG